MCTVFAESEVVSLIAHGENTPDIIKGLHKSICERIANMAKSKIYDREITMTGGVAKNAAVVKTVSEMLNRPINVPEEPQIVGALGAAILAKEKFASLHKT